MNMESPLLDKKVESVEKLCDTYVLKKHAKNPDFSFTRFYSGMRKK